MNIKIPKHYIIPRPLRRLGILFVLALFLLSSCATEIPRLPTSGRATGVFSGYAPAYDVFDNNKTIFTISSDKILTSGEDVVQEISAEHEGGYVWGSGYYYNHKKNRWVSYKLAGERIKDSNWIKGKASATLTIDGEALKEGKNFILAYSCKKMENKWMCGCSSKQGQCNRWMLHYYHVSKKETPPEPEGPGDYPLKQPKITLSTEKKQYSNGEEVRLTPAMETAAEPEDGHNGYIIQFKGEPVIESTADIEEQIKEREDTIERSTVGKATIGLQLDQLKKQLADAANKKRRELEEEHNNAKREISGIIKPGGISSITGNAAAETGSMGEYYNTFNGIALDVDAEDAKKIAELSYVKAVYPNHKVKAMLADAVPLTRASEAWLFNNKGGECSESGACLKGDGIIIGIIDTGVDYEHADLGGCLGEGCKVIGGYDFVNNDNDPMDNNGHGTHLAGIASGEGAIYGIAPNAKIAAYKVLDKNGMGDESNVLLAIEKAVEDKVGIISISIGGPGNPDDPMSTAVNNAVEKGVVVIAAAGNSGPNAGTITSPGTAERAITVGATYKKGYDNKFFSSNCFDHNPTENDIACFSSRGPTATGAAKPDIAAPGVEICSAQWDTALGVDENYNNPARPDVHRCIDDRHMTLSGSSMAVPAAAGAAALLKQAHPEWAPAEIKQSMMESAVDIGALANIQGAGRIDIMAALGLKAVPNDKVHECSDNADNDNDGYADMEDPGCESEDDMAEWDPITQPPSVIKNPNFDAISGELVIGAEQLISDKWEIKKEIARKNIEIKPHETIDLSKVFDDAGGFAPNESGQYRIRTSMGYGRMTARGYAEFFVRE